MKRHGVFYVGQYGDSSGVYQPRRGGVFAVVS